MNANGLKQCAYCESTECMVVSHNGAFSAHCHLCGAHGPRMQTPHEAASAWNHRPFELVALKAHAETLEALGRANTRSALDETYAATLSQAAAPVVLWWTMSEAAMTRDGESMTADQVVLHHAAGASVTVAELRALVDAIRIPPSERGRTRGSAASDRREHPQRVRV